MAPLLLFYEEGAQGECFRAAALSDHASFQLSSCTGHPSKSLLLSLKSLFTKLIVQ